LPNPGTDDEGHELRGMGLRRLFGLSLVTLGLRVLGLDFDDLVSDAAPEPDETLPPPGWACEAASMN
jgi:hypothetical protein